MASRNKVITLFAAASLATAGAVYAFLPAPEGDVAETSPLSRQASAKAGPAVAGDNSSALEAQNADRPVASHGQSQPVADEQTPTTAAPKPTKAQLAPPAPKTEAERLQKAAEQEYNRF